MRGRGRYDLGDPPRDILAVREINPAMRDGDDENVMPAFARRRMSKKIMGGFRATVHVLPPPWRSLLRPI
jgi:hypothetical protein